MNESQPAQKNPVSRLLVLAIGFAGLIFGVLLYTFYYAKGYSYLTDHSQACANCHVMRDQYAGWVKSSHRAVAHCNDCHAPESLLPKYYTKAVNGFFHSVAFTSGRFHEPIQIQSRNKKITEASCLKCHSDVNHQVLTLNAQSGNKNQLHRENDTSCLHCHRNVGHAH